MNIAVALIMLAAGIANFAAGNMFAGVLFLLSACIWVKIHHMQRR